MDDILVFAKTVAEHDNKTLRILFQRLLDAGIRLNKRTSAIGKPKVKFIGYLMSRQQIAIDPERVDAMEEFSTLENRKQLRRILGMATYLTRFSTEMAKDLKTLRELIPETVYYYFLN
jgi:hypothetical protein